MPNKVHSFDHVAVNQSVIVCDIAATGLPDRTLDVAVFALSLMGVNYHDYIREAFRLLRYGGWLKVAEPATRWGEGKLEELLRRDYVMRIFDGLVGNLNTATGSYI